VHFAAARRGAETLHERHVFAGDRHQVRMQTVTAALRLLARRIG
jgi:nicotinamide-nucleotide amidase